MVIARGEVWWAELTATPTGSAPGFRRPVLVIQSNTMNDSLIATVLVAAITSNVELAEAPGNVLIREAESGLPKPSVVNVSQVLTIDKAQLDERIRRLPSGTMQAVSAGLRFAFDLEETKRPCTESAGV